MNWVNVGHLQNHIRGVFSPLFQVCLTDLTKGTEARGLVSCLSCNILQLETVRRGNKLQQPTEEEGPDNLVGGFFPTLTVQNKLLQLLYPVTTFMDHATISYVQSRQQTGGILGHAIPSDAFIYLF